MSSIFFENIQKIFVDKIDEMIVGRGRILIKICADMKNSIQINYML